MEFMFGRPLSPEELEMIREQIESMDDITAIDDEGPYRRAQLAASLDEVAAKGRITALTRKLDARRKPRGRVPFVA